MAGCSTAPSRWLLLGAYRRLHVQPACLRLRLVLAAVTARWLCLTLGSLGHITRVPRPSIRRVAGGTRVRVRSAAPLAQRSMTIEEWSLYVDEFESWLEIFARHGWRWFKLHAKINAPGLPRLSRHHLEQQPRVA